jgi:integrase
LAEADLERDHSVSGGVARIVPTPTQMPESARETTYNGLLPIFGSSHVASEIIARGLNSVNVVLFNLPTSSNDVFVPEATVWCDVGSLEVETHQIEVIRLRLARDLSPQLIQRVQEAGTTAFPAVNVMSSKHENKLFSTAVNAYCTDSSGLPNNLASVAEQRQRKKGCMLFAEFMGDLPLSEIDADRLRAFRDGPLRTLPAKANNLPKALRRHTVKDTVEAIRSSGIDWPLMSLDMQRERMQWLARLFEWLKMKEWIKDNPMASLQGETGFTKAQRKEIGRVKEDDEGRGPFNIDELRLIFSQSWFKTGSGIYVKKPRKWYPFEYWLPLLGLFAGCRISEASQLHLADIKKLDNVFCLDINEDTRDKSLKNDQSKRIVPLHQVLIDLGFLEYCEHLRQEGYRRVFPELTYSKTDARYAKEPIRKMSNMLKALGMPRDLMHVFHCLRHNMNNGLARVPQKALPYADEGLKKFVRYSVMGHKPGDDVNVQHYTSTTPKEMLALVQGLKYDLPPLAKLDVSFAIGQIRVALDNKDDNRRGREDMGPLNEELYKK